jgi:hypothetical protein
VQRPRANEGGREEEENRSGIAAGDADRLHDRKTTTIFRVGKPDANDPSKLGTAESKKFRPRRGATDNRFVLYVNCVVFIETE